MGANIDKPKNGFDVTLHTEDKAEAKRWFDQLAEGGKTDAVRRDLLVARLRLARRQVRRAVDDQRHTLVRLEAPAGLTKNTAGIAGVGDVRAGARERVQNTAPTSTPRHHCLLAA